MTSAKPVTPLTRLQLAYIALGLVGLQFCWAAQVGYVTKTILELGLNVRWTGVVWLAGPIAGIVVQPLVGIASDACTSRFGRRRPYIAGGSLVTCAALLSFGYAREIGTKVGISPLVIAIAAFWALDFAINAAQGPLRTLMADLAPEEQQQEGNAYFAFATGVGNLAGNMLGSLPLAKAFPMFASDGQALYAFASVFLAACMTVLVVNTRETPISGLGERPSGHLAYSSVEAEEPAVKGSSSSAVAVAEDPELAGEVSSHYCSEALTNESGFFAILHEAPFPFVDVFAMQCFTWFAYFCLFIFATSFVGREVYHGSASAPPRSDLREVYDAGVRLGNLGLALNAVVSMGFAAVLPTAVERLTPRTVMFLSHILLGTAMTGLMLLNRYSERFVALFILAVLGIPWSTTMTVPWGLVSAAVLRETPERAGRYLTLFNLSQCFPEVAVSLVSAGVIARTGTQGSMIGLGGAAAFGGAAYIVARRVGDSRPRSLADAPGEPPVPILEVPA